MARRDIQRVVRALGRRAKTDPIDAAVQAQMAVLVLKDAPLWEPVDDVLADLKALGDGRQQLIMQRDAEKKRLGFAHRVTMPELGQLTRQQVARWPA